LQRQHKILRRRNRSKKGRFYDLDLRILEDAAGSGPDVEQEEMIMPESFLIFVSLPLVGGTGVTRGTRGTGAAAMQ